MNEKEVVARRLADLHYHIEPYLTRIFALQGSPESESRPDSPIKLLEVNASTPPSGILPLHFSAAPESGIPYPTVIVEVTPEEFERIERNELRLPDGWAIGAELPRLAG